MTEKKPSHIHKSKSRAEARHHWFHAHGAGELDRGISPQLQLEQVNRAVQKLLAEKNFAGADEVNRYLQKEVAKMTLPQILAQVAQDPVERAQDLAFRSMAADKRQEAIDLARQALELDPNCVDARVTLALAESRTPEEAITRLYEVLARAEEALGPDFMKNYEEEFWRILETRPYMRARELLLSLLRGESRANEAVQVAETTLRLNPGDNQGIRYTLLGLYLETGRVRQAEELMAKYAEEDSAFFRWGAVLARLLGGDTAGAEDAFAAAMASNPYFFEYLTRRRRLPDMPPVTYTSGEPSEGEYCMLQIGPAWTCHPEALTWLDSHPYSQRRRRAA